MTTTQSASYGFRLAIIYAIVWFVDLLDSTSLNVSITAIANSINVEPADAEWVIMGFYFAMTIGIAISGWLGNRFGVRNIVLISQCLYLIASVSCGFSSNLLSLTLSRILQGFSCGLAIPLGLAALLKALPKELWAKTTANINLLTLLAPALGPVFGVYATNLFGWPSIFFLKLPISILALILSVMWIKKDEERSAGAFDWSGFTTGSFSLLGLLWVFSETGKGNGSTHLLLLMIASIALMAWFISIEKRKKEPLFPLEIFKIKRFSIGNFIQSTANAIFLGGNFIIGLYLQDGLKLDLVAAGWVMSCMSPGMIMAQPLIARYYNKWGAMPFMLTGMTLLTLCTLSFILTTQATPYYLLGALVFLIGCASSLAQSSNVVGIFASLPDVYKRSGSSLYSLFKQFSAGFGVAFSAMVFSLAGGSTAGLFSYHLCFAAMAAVPAIGLIFCYFLMESSRDIQEQST